MKKIIVLSGAGMSAESGVSTFRDAGGLWEGHDVMEVASLDGWRRNKQLVLDFYNARRRQLKEVCPNAGHHLLAAMEENYDIRIVTQNVDNLHERAGSKNVLHLHGELIKVRSEVNDHLVKEWPEDLNLGDCAEDGHQLRPHIVWFGEWVPLLEKAAELIQSANYVIIVGTSLQVYPAASLFTYAPKGITIFYVDPRPAPIDNLYYDIKIIAENASTGLIKVFESIKKFEDQEE